MNESSWRISTEEMAARLGVSADTVRVYIQSGVIPAKPAEAGGKPRVVHRAEFERWLERGPEPKTLTPDEIRKAAYEGTMQALAEYQPTVRFEKLPFRVVRPIRARRAAE